MKINQADVTEGVDRAVWAWMAERPVTLKEVFAEAVERAVKEWLESHGEEILTAALREASADGSLRA